MYVHIPIDIFNPMYILLKRLDSLYFDFVLNRYQWFCHFDDDVYVNVKQLSKMLQKYNHNEPYYIGRWPREIFAEDKQFLEVILFYLRVYEDCYLYALQASSIELQHVKELNYVSVNIIFKGEPFVVFVV